MHELALSQSIVELVSELSARRRLRSVSRVELEVGEAAGVECEALRFCFDAVTRGTLAEGARLDIHRVPAVGLCGQCGQEFSMPGGLAPCPHCAHWGARLIAGTELRLQAFEGL